MNDATEPADFFCLWTWLFKATLTKPSTIPEICRLFRHYLKVYLIQEKQLYERNEHITSNKTNIYVNSKINSGWETSEEFTGVAIALSESRQFFV